MIRNISSTSRRLVSGRPNELLFPSRALSKIRLAPYFPIKNGNFRNTSTVNLQEIPTQKAFEEEDAEMATEKEFAELKRALGMTIWQSYNPEHLLLIHPKLRIKREGVAKHTTPQWEVEEAQALCQTIPGYRVVSSIIVGTDKNVRKRLIWKIGRLEAIKEYKQKYNISALMINVDMLSPLQQTELSSYFGVPIYDRFNIVMNIFRLYAKTKEARLQIKLAEIPYIRTRLKFMMNRPGMGIQSQTLQLATALTSISSSDGCKNMDILRLREQRIRKQIKATMETTRQEIVELKAKGGPAKTPVIGIIGYTNSGKTTLIKKLTNSQSLFGENRLFATLDTTTHHAILPSANKVILADTIGFISNLPLKLFASFSATLQHVANADLLIHIMDFSHPNVLAQRDNVFEMLQNLKIQKSLMDNILQVGNKMDKCDSARKEELMGMGLLATSEDEQLEHPILPISCRTTEGMPELIRRMDKAVQIMNGSKIRRLRLAPSSNAIPYLYEHGFVQNVPEPSECGHFLLFDVVMNDNQFAKFQAALGTRFKRKEEGEKEENLER